MDNLNRLIQLAKADGGKFFVIDEKGNPELVIMPIGEYEKVLLKKVQGQIEEIEEINRKIIEAQKTESAAAKRKAEVQENLVSEVIDSTFSFEPESAKPDAQTKAEMEDI